MNKQEIKQEIENLYQRLSELEEELAKPYTPEPKWVPELGEWYWCIMNSNAEKPFCDKNDGMEVDNFRFSIGNVFRTEEEAKFAIERLKVLEEVRRWADGSDFGTNTQKFIIQYNFTNNKVTTEYWYKLFINTEYCFNTRERAQACIDAIGQERLKKYYFGVKN